MPKTEIVRLTDREFKNLRLNTNHVLVKTARTNEGKSTDSGLLVGFNPHVNYAEGEGSHVADLAVVTGEVVKICDNLYYNADDLNDSMLWKTDIEVDVGDEVLFDYLESLNCTMIEVGEDVYRIFPYQALWVARRNDELIPLNGYCLVAPLKREKLSDLDISDEYDLTRGVVRYLGKPNAAYIAAQDNDDVDVSVGDIVTFSWRYVRHPVFLERQKWMAQFSDEPLLRVQRRDFAMVQTPTSSNGYA